MSMTTVDPATVETITPSKATRREWIGLAVLALPTLLVSLDIFVILLALPHLSTALEATSTQQLWILDVYGFMVGGFLITMGTLGDRIGRRRLLLIGAAAFGVSSISAAYSTSAEMLIASRTLLGVAGATLTPSTLSLIMNLFQDPKQRASAVGIWGGCFLVGAIVGPIVGGFMLERFWWGSVFLLGVPAMVLLLAVGPRLLPEYRDPNAGRLDPTSVALSLAALLSIIFGLKELAKSGVKPTSIAAIVVGVIAGTAFLRRQLRLDHPLLDLSLFANRAIRTTLMGLLANTVFTGGTMVLLTQHLQLVDGLSPLKAGLALVPGMVGAIVSLQVAPLLARRVRPAYLLAVGLSVAVAGLLVLSQSDATSGLAGLVVGFAIMGIGGGPLVALGTNLVVGSAPLEKAGSAAGVAQTSSELGYALGIATMGSLGTLVYRMQIADSIPLGLPSAAANAARDTLAGATAAAQQLPSDVGAALLAPARDAFTSGLHVAAGMAALVLAGIAILIVSSLRHLPPIGQEASDPDEDITSDRAHGETVVVDEAYSALDPLW
jgi:DHA2 family multidrug resistance protein-like MFS transporter